MQPYTEYDYTSRYDLRNLYNDLEYANRYQQSVLVLFAIRHDLMRPRGILFRMMLWFSRLKGDADRGLITILNSRMEHGKLVQDMYDQMLDHMLLGKDTYDPKSAGGWNKKELDLFVACAREIGVLAYEDDPV